MTLLHQIIAIEPGVKSKATKALTETYRFLGKPAIFAGLSRTYQPKDDEGDTLPAESTLVQKTVAEILDQTALDLTRLFDVTITKEVGNTIAKADIILDNGDVLLADVPVTYLLFLENKLTDLFTFVSSLPTLDPAQHWTLDSNTGLYVADVVETTRTKKVLKAFVKAEATDKHPAQVDTYNEDIVVGTWSKRDSSGAIPLTRKNELLARVDELQRAVKFAREKANSIEIEDVHVGEIIFNHLFS